MSNAARKKTKRMLSAAGEKNADSPFLTSLVLVDRTCLGIKSACKPEIYSAEQLRNRLAILDDVHRMKQVQPDEALFVIHHAVAYAKNLGFDPHRNFRSEIFEPRPAPLLDTPHANDAKPFYLSVPNDVDYILHQLDEQVRRDNYDYTLGLEGQLSLL